MQHPPDVDVTVLSDRARFLFNPSLIWLPFGKRTPDDITFPVAPTFEAAVVESMVDAADLIDAEAKPCAPRPAGSTRTII